MFANAPNESRPSPEVYRRRRIIVFGALALVVVLMVWGIIGLIMASAAQNAQPADAGFAAPASSLTPSPSPTSLAPSPSPTPSESPSAEPADEPAEVVACAARDIEVLPLSDAETYAAGELPQLSMQLTNTGTTDCKINVGSATQQFTVTSGSDTWWRSTDCQENPSDMEVTLAAGQVVTTVEPLVWDRTRSGVDTCDSPNRAVAPAGGASYHLRVEIGGFAGAGTRQFFLS